MRLIIASYKTRHEIYNAIWKEWRINPHLLRPWSTSKIWLEISYADFVSSAVCHEHYDHPNNLKIESDAFCASGLVVVWFILWGKGSGKQDLRVVMGWSFLFQVFERLPLLLIQALRWRGWGEWRMRAVVAVQESCVLDVSIGNSMICSDIWHKYHEWYFEIVIRNFTSR